MKSGKAKIHTIGIKLRLSYSSERDILYGISNFAQSNCHWSLRLISPTSENVDSTDTNLQRLDGLITSKPMPESFMSENEKLPVVVIGTKDKWLGSSSRRLVFVRNDDEDIGRLGAEFLLQLGSFRTYAFVPTSVHFYYSDLRCKGFVDRLGRDGIGVSVYESGGCQDGSPEDILRMKDWLASLPASAAVMASHDLRATHVLSAAQSAGLDVPSQIAVIGVDNDALLCDFSVPKLTSIFPDHVDLGRIAAQELMMLLSKPAARCKPKTVMSTRKSIVERESARPIAPATHIVEKGMAFIERNALNGIRARDVVKHLGVSHRLASLRFKESTGKSILECIIDFRLREVKRRLETSSTSIQKITAACGFPSESHAKRIFLKHFGMTMRDWRAKSQNARENIANSRP